MEFLPATSTTPCPSAGPLGVGTVDLPLSVSEYVDQESHQAQGQEQP